MTVHVNQVRHDLEYTSRSASGDGETMIQKTLVSTSEEVVKQNPCMNCPGLCCSQNLINICGYDVWVIVRELQIHPSDFIGLACLNAGSHYSFRIDGSDKAYGMVLRMKQSPDGNPRCIFAIDLPNNVVRCGIYQIRPVPCRAYPLALDGDKAVVKPSSLCPDGTWNACDCDSSCFGDELARGDMEYSIYSFLLAVWNREMLRWPEPGRANFGAFFTFLLDVYRQLDPARAAIDADDWPAIWSQWRRHTACQINPLSSRTALTGGTASLTQWLRSVREIILEAKPVS